MRPTTVLLWIMGTCVFVLLYRTLTVMPSPLPPPPNRWGSHTLPPEYYQYEETSKVNTQDIPTKHQQPQAAPPPILTTPPPPPPTASEVQQQPIKLKKHFAPHLNTCMAELPMWDQKYTNEFHHFSFGRAWALGRDNFEFLKQHVNPTDRLLDFGCGALRLGIWLIDYLDTGNYYGVEYNTEMYQAGIDYELKLHDLEHKKPNMYNNKDGQPGLVRWGVKFDTIVGFAVLIHLEPPLKKTVLHAWSKFIKPTGTIWVSHRLPFDGGREANNKILAKFNLELDGFSQEYKSKFMKTESVWLKLKMKDPSKANSDG
eukprot:TRINITY_DN74972_c0_g1_i1.p1 TRINITY_DN74972_c0_g1~~TRINITY_DN74972_c0_g1_i1.p1  ORF type:complete len:314 (-),score=40.54 TRINITY_DN74972_c0_g1_i1:279-1220(-)